MIKTGVLLMHVSKYHRVWCVKFYQSLSTLPPVNGQTLAAFITPTLHMFAHIATLAVMMHVCEIEMNLLFKGI